ncbi:MAG: glycosyltransferase [Methylococcales bacterium]|nr:glycosyltransferase [Methylococcales bacterium]
MTKPVVSVVVIGRNEGQRLAACLKSIKEVTLPIELIYVDSNSQDSSPELAEGLGAKVLLVNPQRPCAAIGRNAGWRAATAPYILFLDGDTLLHPDFLQLALNEMADETVAVVWGHRREMYPEHSLYNRVLDLDWIYPAGISEFCGGDTLMRRNILEQVDGFSENLIAGEEPELCQRIRAQGKIILHIDQPMTLHDLAMTQFNAYWRRALRAGHAYAEVSQRMKNTAFPLWQHDCRRNAIHATVLIGLLLASVLFSVITGSVLTIVGLLFAYTFLIVRSAYKARWRNAPAFTLLLYGIHSHFQQIPIACGQLSYWYHRFRNKQQGLIEYK